MAEFSTFGWATSPRDPARIPAVLQEIQRIWEKNPDLRLSQLVGNVSNYYTEDDKLLVEMKKLYDR